MSRDSILEAVAKEILKDTLFNIVEANDRYEIVEEGSKEPALILWKQDPRKFSNKYHSSLKDPKAVIIMNRIERKYDEIACKE
jgi:hypothetical protein